MSLCGNWRLDREIGHGAYGVVYAAANAKGERAAVKVCRRDDIGEECYNRELRGAKLYSSIPPQEGLVRMREFAEEPWGFYAVMDLADDEFGREVEEVSYRPKTLTSVIAGEHALPLGECVKLGIALAKGLEALQRHHLLHRDIKPGNVIYVRGCPVLSDPGLVVEGSESVSRVGTPGYLPPEGFTSASSDIYCLGLTLKAACFGRSIEDLDKGPAMEADTGAKFFHAWWRILNRATDPIPSNRYQSAKALLKDLKSLQTKVVVAAKSRYWVKRAILPTVAIVVILIGMSIYNAWLIAFWRNASTSFGSWGACWRLSESLRYTKVTTSDSNKVARVVAAQKELSEMMSKSQGLSRRFKELEETADEKYKKGRNIMKETFAAKKIIAEEAALQKRVLEIGNSFYKNWNPFHL